MNALPLVVGYVVVAVVFEARAIYLYRKPPDAWRAELAKPRPFPELPPMPTSMLWVPMLTWRVEEWVRAMWARWYRPWIPWVMLSAAAWLAAYVKATEGVK